MDIQKELLDIEKELLDIKKELLDIQKELSNIRKELSDIEKELLDKGVWECKIPVTTLESNYVMTKLSSTPLNQVTWS